MQQSTMDKYSHLLNPTVPNPTADDYWQAAAAFTNACCFEEQATYRLIANDGDGACDHPTRPVTCDKVVNLHSGDVYDLVASGGLSSQKPSFNKVMGQKVNPNQFVVPVDPNPLTGTTPPPANAEGFPPYPGDQHFDPIGQALFDDYAEAKTTPNPGMSRWFGRCDYDYLTGIVASNVEAVNKHRPDWRKELGLPPKASSQG
jgi:hypothetical protein